MEPLPPDDLDVAIDEADLDAAVAAIDDADFPAAEEAPVTYEMDMTARWGSQNAVVSGGQTGGFRPKPKVPTIPSNFKRRYGVHVPAGPHTSRKDACNLHPRATLNRERMLGLVGSPD